MFCDRSIFILLWNRLLIPAHKWLKYYVFSSDLYIILFFLLNSSHVIFSVTLVVRSPKNHVSSILAHYIIFLAITLKTTIYSVGASSPVKRQLIVLCVHVDGMSHFLLSGLGFGILLVLPLFEHVREPGIPVCHVELLNELDYVLRVG
jgi:hypothetical protein